MLVMVYHQGSPLGEAEIYPQNEKFDAMESCKKEIRITDFSPSSERCSPLAVLHTIASCGLCFKMEAKPPQAHELPLFALYSACLRENKTAIVQLGEEELHLVAMPTRNKLKPFPCFWGFIVYPRLYGACLNMLNLRCLGIVFDLDETLIVANTMRSFEDRIEALQRKISTELDSQRIVGMLAEVKRYQDDKSILKQYVEGDQVSENGKVVKVQSEIVPPMLDSHRSIIRPIIRLNDQNIILTRINPLIRDTSVLVRLRPAWDELRSYLTAKGRKRFEVYVCTMAERDYALEMWRLLDPESNLINSKELLDRIVCVKSGSKKSLLNVFQYGICHPKMAMVIDDRLKVWDDKDQPRVHVVPAYAPYYAPQAEASNAVPVLCVARNVACNVRGGFFKEFDEGLLQRMSCVVYEDDLSVMSSAPDVSSYLNSEEDSSISLGNKDLPVSENLAESEVERKIKGGNSFAQLPPIPAVINPDPVLQPSQFALVAPSNILAHQSSQFALGNLHAGASQKTSGPVIPSESSLQNSPGREEGEVPESELDPDTRRRLLILQHGQDTREQTATDPPFPLRPSIHMPTPPVQLHGSWPPIEEEMSPRQPARVRSEFLLEQENLSAQLHYPPFYATMNGPIPSDKSLYESQRSLKEVHIGDDRLQKSHSPHASFDEVHHGFAHGPLSTRDLHVESCQNDSENPTSPLLALQDISMKIGEKVNPEDLQEMNDIDHHLNEMQLIKFPNLQLNFKSLVNAGMDLQFSFEVWFVGQKIGEGTGTTRRNAQLLAAQESLQNLANKYISSIPLELRHLPADPDKIFRRNDNGFINDPVSSFGYVGSSRQDIPIASTSEHSRFSDQRSLGSQRPSSVSSLKEWCMMEGLNLVFQEQPSLSVNTSSNGQVYAQVEVSGRVVGKGIGSNWEEAKQQAAQEALANLKSPPFPQRNSRRLSSPRSSHTSSVKRVKRDFARGFSRASSARYSKNGPPVS